MKRFLEKKGFKLKKVKEDSLNKTRDVAIALVKREFNLTSYHWICYPDDDIDFYGSETKVVKIYLITK